MEIKNFFIFFKFIECERGWEHAVFVHIKPVLDCTPIFRTEQTALFASLSIIGIWSFVILFSKFTGESWLVVNATAIQFSWQNKVRCQ